MNPDCRTEETNRLDTRTDQVLLGRFVGDHDSAAFDAIVRRHGPMVMGVCRRVLGHAHDAEDAFQATFLVLARKAATIQNFPSLAGWVYKVAYRIALRARASRNQRRANECRLAVERGHLTPMDRQRDISWLVDEEVQRLPEKYRTPVLLCYLQGQTNEEAAQLLRCPTGTIKIRLLRGREMLRKRLIRQGVALSLLAGLTTELCAAVSSQLLQDTISAASRLGAGARLANLGISSTVLYLARSWLRRMAIGKVRVAGSLLLALLLLFVSDQLANRASAATASRPSAADPANAIPVPPEFQSPSVPEQPAVEWVFTYRSMI
jgi:RNA polymerase sigma factor (sigma-70 family)